MSNIDVLNILRSKYQTHEESVFDSLIIDPIYNYLSPYDIESLHKIATSNKLSSKIKEKYRLIDDIMRPRGFKRFAAGTNRIVYSHYEDTRFLAKIAVDKIGMSDNPAEYKNQFLLKPYVAKMFYTSPCGTVGFSERVIPVKNPAEFRLISSDVFDILYYKILGKYIVEDVGSKFFMNWGVRAGEGPVLLDYPYIYKLDGNKLYCTKELDTGEICEGEIDYDVGFNFLTCSKCGKRYTALDLRDNKNDNKIIIKGGTKTMKASIIKGEKVLACSYLSDEVIRRPNINTPHVETKKEIHVQIEKGERLLACSYSNVCKHNDEPCDLDTTVIKKEEIVEQKPIEEEQHSEPVKEEVCEEPIPEEIDSEESESEEEVQKEEIPGVDIEDVDTPELPAYAIEDNTIPYVDSHPEKETNRQYGKYNDRYHNKMKYHHNNKANISKFNNPRSKFIEDDYYEKGDN